MMFLLLSFLLSWWKSVSLVLDAINVFGPGVSVVQCRVGWCTRWSCVRVVCGVVCGVQDGLCEVIV
jgi:hypothetical protein